MARENGVAVINYRPWCPRFAVRSLWWPRCNDTVRQESPARQTLAAVDSVSRLRGSFDELFDDAADSRHVGARLHNVSVLLIDLQLELRDSGKLH